MEQFDKNAMLELCFQVPELLKEFRELNCPGSDEEPDLKVLYEKHVVNGALKNQYLFLLHRPHLTG